MEFIIGKRFEHLVSGTKITIVGESFENDVLYYAGEFDEGSCLIGHNCNGLIPNNGNGWWVTYGVLGESMYDLTNSNVWKEIVDIFWQMEE